MTFVLYPIRRAQEIPYGLTTGVLYAVPERDGVVIDPSSVTVDIYRSGETTPSVVDGVVTEDGTTHALSHTLDASNTSTWFLGCDAIAEFKCAAASGAPIVIRKPFKIVRVPMVHVPPMNVNDLKRAHVSVEAKLTNKSITDPERWIVTAWAEILAWAESHGKIPGFITNPDVLAPMLHARALSLMFRALSVQPDDNDAKNAERWQAEYEASVVNPGVLQYDPADSRAPVEEIGWTQPIIDVSGRGHFRARGGVR